MTRQDILQKHFSQAWQKVPFSYSSVTVNRPRSSGEFLVIQPGLDETLQSQLRSFVGQAALNLGQGLPYPFPALLLCFFILGQAPAFQADLCAPQAIFALVNAAFVVSSSSSHMHSSFLLLWKDRLKEWAKKHVLFDF